MKNHVEVHKVVSDFVNNMSDSQFADFNREMGRDHRTLQQRFTTMCLMWLEYAADDRYQFDARNEATHKVAKEMITKWKEAHDGFKPSRYLPFI